MDAGFVRERVRADDGLVRRYDVAGQPRDQRGRRSDLRRVDAGLDTETVVADTQGHDDLLQCGVPRTLADPVHCALDLPDPGLDSSEGVGHSEAEVVVAVRGDRDFIEIRSASPD